MGKGKNKKKANLAPRIENRRAKRDYNLSGHLECGIVLRGSEVKSVRHSRVSIAEGYAAATWFGANGANVMVAGTSTFRAPDMAEAIRALR